MRLSKLRCTFRTVLVYRLGGTTLDVTIVAVNGGMYRIVATENDTTLGGVKFDELLAQHLAAEFQRFLCICELKGAVSPRFNTT